MSPRTRRRLAGRQLDGLLRRVAAGGRQRDRDDDDADVHEQPAVQPRVRRAPCAPPRRAAPRRTRALPRANADDDRAADAGERERPERERADVGDAVRTREHARSRA